MVVTGAAGLVVTGAAGLVVTGAAGLVVTGAAGLAIGAASALAGVRPGAAARSESDRTLFAVEFPGAVRAFAGGVLAGVSTAPLAGRDVCPCERTADTSFVTTRVVGSVAPRCALLAGRAAPALATVLAGFALGSASICLRDEACPGFSAWFARAVAFRGGAAFLFEEAF